MKTVVRFSITMVTIMILALAAVFTMRILRQPPVESSSAGGPTRQVSTATVAVEADDAPNTRSSPLPLTNTPAPTLTRTPKGHGAVASNPGEVTGTISHLLVTPSVTPTSRPQIKPTLAISPGDLSILEGVPTPVPTFDIPERITNILLLGSDTPVEEGIGRTDTIIIVAINQDGPTASMLSLPRDLWVYVPGWKNSRINTALSHGETSNYPDGGIKQLTDTILYNFGVPIHYYAQVDFNGFKDAVDIMGGVDLAVSCELRDWRLKSPELNPEDEDNWEIFTLEPGVYHMDGDTALWYARSRRSTSDFDRGRRQQQLLRAMLNNGVDLNILARAPELWATYQDSVTTDLDIGRLLQLATLAPAVRTNGVQHLYTVGEELQPYVVPDNGAQVQIPVWDKMSDTFRRLFLPPALNQASRPPITVEIIDASGKPDMALLVADNLERYGFEPIINETAVAVQRQTTIEYFAQNTKGSFDWLFSWIVAKKTEDIQLVPDTPYPYDYRLVIGSEHNPCRPQLFAPQIFLDD